MILAHSKNGCIALLCSYEYVFRIVLLCFLCEDFCGTQSVRYGSFLDSCECKVTDEHRIEGQEIGVSLSTFELSLLVHSSW